MKSKQQNLKLTMITCHWKEDWNDVEEEQYYIDASMMITNDASKLFTYDIEWGHISSDNVRILSNKKLNIENLERIAYEYDFSMAEEIWESHNIIGVEKQIKIADDKFQKEEKEIDEQLKREGKI